MITTRTTLLERMREGPDQRCWAEFQELYAPMFLAICKRSRLSDSESADAIQETLLAVHKNFQKLEGPFDNRERRFRDWLGRIIRNKVIDIIKKRKPTAPLDDALIGDESKLDRMIDEEWKRNRLERACVQVRREVSPAKWQAFEFYAIHGRRVKEVAKLLGITPNMVYMGKCRVVARLHELVSEFTEEGG